MPTNYIFCDESRQCSERYMVLGGITIMEENISKIDNTINNYRDEYKMYGELKWRKVSIGKMKEYKGFIDYFFAICNNDLAHFRCMIFDTHQINHKKYNHGDKEEGFNKQYYQLLLRAFACLDIKDNRDYLHIRPDSRTSKTSLQDFRDILNKGINKEKNLEHRVKTIEAIDSKSSNIIQINDIILGAIGYHKNGLDKLDGASAARVELAKYIADLAGVYSLANNTKFGVIRFKIWNFNYQGK